MISVGVSLIILAIVAIWLVIQNTLIWRDVKMVSVQVQAVVDSANAVKAAVDAKLAAPVTLSADDVNALGTAVTTLQAVTASLASPPV